MVNPILKQAHALQQQITDHRRWLHSHPGVGFELQETKEYVRQVLEKMGLTAVDCGRCGLYCDVCGSKGKTILLRADMDALPIKEDADIDFASTNGYMHACGHDMHTAMLLGAAQILTDHQKDLQGTVRLMFQPAEEILAGASDMIENGVLSGVDAAVMIHVAVPTEFSAGTLIVSAPGVTAPSAEYFTIHVQGKGCHGSMPQNGVDALTIGAQLLIALQELKARELAADSGAVLTIGSFQGGTAGNVIADKAILKGTLRTYDEQDHLFIKQRLVEIAQGMATIFRGSASVEFGPSCPTLTNDATLCNAFYQYLKDLLGNEGVINAAGTGNIRSGGSEDFAYISHQIPSVMLALAAGEPGRGYDKPLHHPQVRFDEQALPYGTAALAQIAIAYLAVQ